MGLKAEEITLLKAYQKYVDAGMRYMAGQINFRKRVAEGALEAERSTMQEALRELLHVAVESFDETSRELVLMLPAEGRIGMTQIVDLPRYQIANLPVGSQHKKALLWRGRDDKALIKDFRACLVPHKIQLDEAWEGEAPLFGSLLPFRLDFSL